MQWRKEIVSEGGSVFYFAGEDTHALHKMRQTQMDFPITSDYQYIAGRDDEFASPGEFLQQSKITSGFVDQMRFLSIRWIKRSNLSQ